MVCDCPAASGTAIRVDKLETILDGGVVVGVVWLGEVLLGVGALESLVADVAAGEGTVEEGEDSAASAGTGGMGTPNSTSRASYFSILSGFAFLLAILSFWRIFSSSSSSALVRAALDSPSES